MEGVSRRFAVWRFIWAWGALRGCVYVCVCMYETERERGRCCLSRRGWEMEACFSSQRGVKICLAGPGGETSLREKQGIKRRLYLV